MKMTLRKAKTIIKITPHGQHEYTLKCPECGKSENWSTDDPEEKLTEMAEKHVKCKEGK